jgi:hypothetical protein
MDLNQLTKTISNLKSEWGTPLLIGGVMVLIYTTVISIFSILINTLL